MKLDDWNAAYHEMKEHAQKLEREIAAMTKQRDEARKGLIFWQSLAECRGRTDDKNVSMINETPQNHSQRGDYFPWHCPNCGEWETTQRVRTTWWENRWKNWGDYGAFECPRCSHRYPL